MKEIQNHVYGDFANNNMPKLIYVSTIWIGEVNGEMVFYTKHAQVAIACSYDFLIKESRWSTVQVDFVKK